MNAPFVVVEGIDGAGKTTVVPAVIDALADLGWERCVATREPWSDKARNMMAAEGLSGDGKAMFQAAVAFMDREAHCEWMQCYLNSGTAVVSDRFWPSSVAYQGIRAYDLNRTFYRMPDLYIYLRLPVEVAEERIAARGREFDPFEEHRSLVEASNRYEYVFVGMGYKGWPRAVIDATMSEDEVASKAREAVMEWIKPSLGKRPLLCSMYI